ncbi:ATP-binding cassette domain-containing protein [Planomonospora sp. ID67723]|uniref:ATP-binding cassette domain-containing protein n=1 Tax=Planomonospora sp. ID67723 TaxID=2738134 RepID=UPI0018C437A9|nr:ATP-binding cassette domain-containing protein [Planomonospora sp. ID67723]MBG0832708.1 ATP-binding cassette domain-containing protein [Planomonospora sp. ID67723]
MTITELSATTREREAWITVEGARTHNLRGVSVRVPKRRLTVFTGVSGSGKSSLAFDTIAAEAQRLVGDTYPTFVRNRLPQHPQADVDRLDGLMFTTVVDQRRFTGNARSTVGTASDIAPLLRLVFSRAGRPSAGFTPAYSFNDPAGMCPRCEGLGVVDDIDVGLLLDRSRSLREGAIRFPAFAPGTYRWKRLVHARVADPDLPLSELPPSALDTVLHAEGLRLANPDPEYPASGVFDGVIPRLRQTYLRRTPSRLTEDEREALARVVTRRACPGCAGTRLNDRARASLIDDRSIADWYALPVSELRHVAGAVTDPAVAPITAAICDRLDALDAVGLGYLSLDRGSGTLSGGEAQRVKIVRHLGSALSDVCYVFDEPSTGLHPHDVHRLLELLTRLRDATNTILVVEHHPAVIAAADHVIDLGPAAGAGGGVVQFEGVPAGLRDTDTETGRMLRDPIRLRRHSRTPRGSVTIAHAKAHNLRDVTVEVPLGVFTAVTGVAGSGKSTLFAHVLPRQHPDFTVVGQAPLHGGVRSTPATVLGVADTIRDAFSRAAGLHPSWFSSNARGACPVCRGKGAITTDLAFLDDVETSCDACGGTRFNATALAATLHGHTIADALAMNPAEAAALFADRADAARRLDWLDRVGLGYLAIGQSLDTLSGGERQRLQLARHLGDIDDAHDRRIVLDEPTAGLHGTDVDRLLALFDDLVDDGATIIAIEHDQRVIAQADHVIDIGPGAGLHGGAVVFQGPPRALIGCPASTTGRYLHEAVRGVGRSTGPHVG